MRLAECKGRDLAVPDCYASDVCMAAGGSMVFLCGRLRRLNICTGPTDGRSRLGGNGCNPFRHDHITIRWPPTVHLAIVRSRPIGYQRPGVLQRGCRKLVVVQQ